MASFTVPCPKSTSVAPMGQVPKPSQTTTASSAFVQARSSSERARALRFQSLKRNQSTIRMAQVNEVSIESSNSVPRSSTKLEAHASDGEDAKAEEELAPPAPLSDPSISVFMAGVSNLIKLVDSKDIVELQLQQRDFELSIRKKEALPQPPPTAPVVMMPPTSPQAMLPSQPPLAPAAAPAAPAPAFPAPAKSGKSSLPPLKCPMAGTFYRCSGPGEPPFVKVGDKVQKGQVICIIEAMKLMNEIEADQSGTVIEILAEDGKPVSVDMPLLVIEP
ncbi:hypothetical protein QJS04_geneDACA008027 [Acorus gramineus]|uniref:Biotin carboxyl carrier protein of acetyl-CoA carboxylase n=1 Tax=Acorus gramineus TaxID=55184 RepID=A0AAV9B931_ACOGR|nr:hypothetical protein QJS04_geneDACA008027 [Acorus gramineus]